MEIVHYTYSNFVGFGSHVSVNFRMRVINRYSQELALLSRESGKLVICDDETPYEFAGRVVAAAREVLEDLSVAASDAGFPDIARQIDISFKNTRQVWHESNNVIALCALALWMNGLNMMDFSALYNQKVPT